MVYLLIVDINVICFSFKLSALILFCELISVASYTIIINYHKSIHYQKKKKKRQKILRFTQMTNNKNKTLAKAFKKSINVTSDTIINVDIDVKIAGINVVFGSMPIAIIPDVVDKTQITNITPIIINVLGEYSYGVSLNTSYNRYIKLTNTSINDH